MTHDTHMTQMQLYLNYSSTILKIQYNKYILLAYCWINNNIELEFKQEDHHKPHTHTHTHTNYIYT